MAIDFDPTVRPQAIQGLGDHPFGNDGMDAITKSKEAVRTVFDGALQFLGQSMNRIGQHGSNLKNRVAGGSSVDRHPLEWKALLAILATKQDKPCAIREQSEAHAERSKERKQVQHKRMRVEIKEQKALLSQHEGRVMELEHEKMLKTLL